MQKIVKLNTDIVKAARLKKGYSIRKMSEFLGAKSSATYFNIENNKSEAKATQLKIISEVLGISLKKMLA